MSQQSQMCFHGYTQKLINMVSEVGLLQGIVGKVRNVEVKWTQMLGAKLEPNF